MNKYRLFILGGMLIFSNMLKAQLYQNNEKSHIGMKAGSSFSMLIGEELQNPFPKFVFSGGVFLKHKLSESFHFQTEVLASFKGSRFKNGLNRYERITLFYVDIPVYLQYDVSKKENKHIIFAGPQPSFLLNSEVYVNSRNKALYKDLALKKYDVFAVAGYQYNGYYTGFQVALKAGLTNINNGLEFVDVLPVTGTGKSIRNISLDFSFLF